MLRRILLALTFVSAFTFMGVGVADNAEAWRRWGRGPYVTYYAGPPRDYYYDGYVPYRAYYSGYTPYRAYYGRPAFYRPYYRSYYYGPRDYYYYGPRSGVSVSVGF